MEILRRLGMKKEWIYEVVVLTLCQSLPHSAPIGVWTENFKTLKSEIYKGSKTLDNMLKHKNYSVNLQPDTIGIHNTLFAKQQLVYENSKKIGAPLLSGASANLELNLRATEEKDNTFIVEGEIVSIRAGDKINLINRAEGLVLENLVLSTKLPHLPGKGIRNVMKENYRVIRKVAPGSDYEKVAESLIRTLNL